jgi:hypothetical protein
MILEEGFDSPEKEEGIKWAISGLVAGGSDTVSI